MRLKLLREDGTERCADVYREEEAQMRLKHQIDTLFKTREKVDREEEAQMRLKLLLCLLSRSSCLVDREEEAQMRLKHKFDGGTYENSARG